MKLSENGKQFIVKEEGLRLKAYKCQAGVWTIGVGHVDPTVVEGKVITKEEAMQLFDTDIARFDDAVNKYVLVGLEQHEHDALVSFTFNVGVGAFKSSTLLKKLNEGNKTDTMLQFLRWTKAGGKTIPVLVGRRERESKLFSDGVYT